MKVLALWSTGFDKIQDVRLPLIFQSFLKGFNKKTYEAERAMEK